jgi:hypothetical protein
MAVQFRKYTSLIAPQPTTPSSTGLPSDIYRAAQSMPRCIMARASGTSKSRATWPNEE